MSGVALHLEALGVVTTDERAHPILHDVHLALARGESVGLVGRSGAGKSTLGNAVLRLLPRGLALTTGSRVLLGRDDVLTLDAEQLRRVRGRRIAMVFQEPLRALDPAMRVGPLLAAALDAHGMASGREAEERAVAMLAKVGLADAGAAAGRYAHELSGGMRQRVLLALALLLEPEVLIADEPTTALDPTLQAQLLDRLDDLRRDTGTAMLLISHDRALVGERCERVLRLDRGHIVEDITRTIRQAPVWPTAAPGIGIDGSPRAGGAADGPARADAPLAVADGLSVHFPAPRRLRDRPSGVVHAVQDVSLTLMPGDCLGLVGESGCGKTTLARALLGLVTPTAGRVTLRGRDLASVPRAERRALRRFAQLVPQDAGASLTPERTVLELVREGLEVHGLAAGDDATRRAHERLAEVGLSAAFADRRPGSLSTGERQRVAIARALACDPGLLICDEPVANVDAELREQLLELLDRLRRERGLALLFISHDLAAVHRLASRVAVMYLGRIVECADSAAPLEAPRMPYTLALREALPTGDPTRPRARRLPQGDIPSPLQPPDGCPFHTRCPHPLKDDRCMRERPPLLARTPERPDHLVACWHDPLPRTP